jgi:uncharacterized membrane protein YdjX (TVP38/TMEM64 family)
MKLFSKRNTALIISFAFIGFLVWSTVEFQHYFSKILLFFQGLVQKDETLSILIFIGISALATMLSSFIRVLPIPIALILWGNTPTMLYLLAGWLIGDALSYAIGYFAGNPIVKKIVSFDKIDYYREKIPPNAQFRLILFFVTATPAEIPNYVLGVIRYAFAKYFIATIFSELIYAYLSVWTGQALVQQNFVAFVIALFLLLVLFSYSFHLFNKYLKSEENPEQ